ncbi:MAG: hypothetical protein QF704_07000, partial [Anaerolineales bacterium]|nr:hypothetical protein [Anaerolineales bacterium]
VVILIVILIFAYIALKISYNIRLQPPPQTTEPTDIEEIVGIFVDLNDNEFILDKGGQIFTLVHEGLADDVNIIKVLQDKSFIDSNIEELDEGDKVTIVVENQGDKRIVKAIAIEKLP